MTGTSPQKKTGAERRASIRYPVDIDSFSPENACRPITSMKEESWAATLRDVSTGGIGLAVSRRFEMGTILTVDLEDAERTSTRTLLVRVVRVTQENPATWLLGCAFTSQLSESDLLSLM
jgi:hypothetical protein